MCGIDLENELDWPIESVRIYNNRFYSNKKAAVLVHRGSSNTLVQQNNISGYLALVSGERTSIDGNTISGGGIYSVDTSDPLYTYINKNTLTNASIEVKTNKGAVISNNAVTNGTIKLNYASGALYNNKVSNTASKSFAIQVFADSQAAGYAFAVYLYGNTATGTYTKAISVSNYSNLKVSYDQTQVQQYIDNFGEEPIPQGVLELKPDYTLWFIAGAVVLLAAAVLAWFLLKKKHPAGPAGMLP